VLPVVVIAGRPNVGKSTLFNRLAGRRAALVAYTPGVTRDRKEATAMLRGRNVRLMDTAGLEESAPDSLYGRMRASSEVAVGLADLVVFVVDARTGITPADEHFAAWLRRQGRPVLVVANKAEGRGGAQAAMEAYSLGLGEPLAVSAEHGEGLANLMGEIADRLPPAEPEGDDFRLKLAIVGRPNAGKSTLLNRLLGEERMITGPEPGLTRDSVAVMLADEHGPIELVDTAGLRRKARIDEALEKMSTSATIEALKMAMTQSRGVPVVTLSAMTGAGVDKLLPAVRRAHAVWNTRVGTGELNRWFESALERHAAPLVDGRRLKLRYMTQAKARPPTFIIFGTRAEQTPEDYRRYLVNGLRETFALPGTPIRLQFRGTKNPYADEKTG